MDDDAEQLDWGNDEEEQQHGGSVESAEVRRGADAEDAEDAVSLGGDEDEPEFYAYDARAQDNTPRGRASTPKSATIPQPQTHSRDRHHERERSMSSQRGRTSSYRQNSPQASPSLARSQSFGKLTHALPPKPVVSNVPFVHQPHLSTIEATAMVAKRHERANGKSDSADSLPPDWEVRRPSSGRGVYFYNLRTQESTWTRPGTKDKERGRSGKMNDRGTPTKVSEQRSSSRPTRPEHVGQPSTGDLSYEDRHYRPGGEPGNDGLVTSEITPSQVPDTPPRSPIIYERGRSPSRSRQRHSHRQLSLDVPSNDRSIRTDSARDPSRFTARSPDRRWAASREPVALGPSSASSRHRNVVSKMSPPPQEYRNYQGDVVSSSASSTLSASSSHLSTSRVWRNCSSQGGGRISSSVSRSLGGRVAYPLLLCSASSPNRLQDAHHGSLCSSPLPIPLFIF
ncbi:hypothetical protein PLICRDRAFT_38020 [Plicaturopsis crispa FD-325 SS-3]|nr:hypothetical protein PLICRDRAFT_38020 [Plicaturopsis crispa FD-325 SS-3]